MGQDFPDWTSGYQIVNGTLYGLVAQDFPDWTDGVTSIAGPITAGADFPDWTKAVSDASSKQPLTGMLFWFDATQITGHADGDNLTVVPDESGNGYNGSPATVKWWTTTTANLINGHPAFTMTSGGNGIGQTFPTLPQPFTLYIVCQVAGASPGGFLWTNNDPLQLGLFGSPSQPWEMDNLTSGWATNPPTDSTAHVISNIMTGGNGSEMLIDGVVKNSGNGVTGPTSSALHNGTFGASIRSSSVFGGPIGEIIGYARADSPTQSAAVVTYLKNKWGTP